MDSLTSTASNEYSNPIVDKDVYAVDPFLVEALQNPRHRLTVVRMEQNIQQFLQNAHAQQFEFQYLPSSYLRLVAHRVSQHYGLQTLVQDNALDGQGTKIIVRKLTESRYPAMHLSEILIKQLGNEKNENVKIVLMQKSCNASSNEGGQSGIKCNHVKTVEERMEDYDRARARIFSSHVPSSPELEDTMCQAAEEGNPSCMADPERSFSIKDAAGLPSRVAIFKDREKDLTDPDMTVVTKVSDHDSAGSSSSNTTSGHVQKIDLSIEEVSRATNNFSDGNKIGEGEFGKVYKGKLKDGTPVAVKRVPKDLYDYGSSHEFRNEILKLSKIEHHNLVKLYGFLEQGSERITIFEYVGNGTLREHLDGFRGGGLEIAERLDIAIDIAHALTYLHSYSDPPVIHRDVNSSNILITENLRARVADFGFVKIITEDMDATHISTQVKGSAVYLDPEYAKTHQLTEKSDVYSFGILLVEMMTGRNPVEPKKSHKERVTSRWAMQKLRDGEVVLVMDIKLKRTPASLMVVEQILKLARYCLAPQRQSRPSMKNCVEALWKIRKELNEKHISLAASAPHHTVDVNVNVKEHHRKMFGIEEIDKRFLSA